MKNSNEEESQPPQPEQQQAAHTSDRSRKQAQLTALYGPPASTAEHHQEETISFCSRDTGYRVLMGKILFVRAPAPAIKGGRIHPIIYITEVEGEQWPRIVYPGDIVER